MSARRKICFSGGVAEKRAPAPIGGFRTAEGPEMGDARRIGSIPPGTIQVVDPPRDQPRDRYRESIRRRIGRFPIFSYFDFQSCLQLKKDRRPHWIPGAEKFSNGKLLVTYLPRFQARIRFQSRKSIFDVDDLNRIFTIIKQSSDHSFILHGIEGTRGIDHQTAYRQHLQSPSRNADLKIHRLYFYWFLPLSSNV